MNRFPIVEKENFSYIIIPFNIPSCFDIPKATASPFILYKLVEKENKNEFVSFTNEDAKLFDSLYDEITSEKNVSEKKARHEESYKIGQMIELTSFVLMGMGKKKIIELNEMIKNNQTEEVKKTARDFITKYLTQENKDASKEKNKESTEAATAILYFDKLYDIMIPAVKKAEVLFELGELLKDIKK